MKCLIFLFFSLSVSAGELPDENIGWIIFNRTTAPGPETNPTNGLIVVDGVELKGEILINSFGEIYNGQNQVNFNKTDVIKTKL